MQTKRRDEGPSNSELTAKKAKSEIPTFETTDMEVANGKPGVVELDEDLHSRQLAVYGREAMRRMVGASILVSGLRGLGVEVGKSLYSFLHEHFSWSVVELSSVLVVCS